VSAFLEGMDVALTTTKTQLSSAKLQTRRMKLDQTRNWRLSLQSESIHLAEHELNQKVPSPPEGRLGPVEAVEVNPTSSNRP